MSVKAGQDAHVVLSLGPQKVTIPLLLDESLRAAQVDLLRAGMQLGEASSIYLPGGEEDSVLQQDPAPGTTDVTSPHVDLLVSLGPRPPAFVMPELSGLQFSEAESKLNASGLRACQTHARRSASGSCRFRGGTVSRARPACGCKHENRIANRAIAIIFAILLAITAGLPATNLCNRLSRRGVNTVLPPLPGLAIKY